jgi:mRNA interferase MazF
VNIKRGDIYLADLSNLIENKYEDIRPVMVIQNDISNRFAPTVIVNAITSQISEGKLPTHVNLEAEKFNRLSKKNRYICLHRFYRLFMLNTWYMAL